jgi:hypothetical protein
MSSKDDSARHGSPLLLALFLFVVAPLGAAVVVAVLLLFGVPPRVVFAPGWGLKSLVQSAGVHAPNAVGVLATVGLWWFLFAALGLMWERRRRVGNR